MMLNISIRKSPPTPLACLRGREKIAKEGEFLPFVKGGKEGFSLPCLYNYGLTNMLLDNKTPKKGTDDESLTLFS